jgi:PAS domain S-box-containing protein
MFQMMDEGFCIVQVLFDGEDHAVDYRFLEVNPAFERQTGLQDVVGRTAKEQVPELEAGWFQVYGRVATTGDPVRFVHDARSMEGRWFNVNAFRVGEPESRTIAILFTDITIMKRAEAERSRLAAIVESSRDAIIGVGLDGRISDWNPAAQKLYGYSAVEIVEQDIEVLIPEKRTNERVGVLARLREGEDLPPFETERQRKDGSLVDVEIRVSPIRDDADQIVGAAVIARDVTTRKQLERVQEDFVAMVSHDLRSPVTVLHGRTQLMRRRGQYDEKGLDAMLEQIRRMERLITDLQEVVKFEAGAIELNRLSEELGDLARDAVERARVQDSGHTIRVIRPETPVAGTWDRDRLGQVLDNLLGNAVKYSPQGREIVVRVAIVDGEARLCVRDQGDGIPAATLPNLFERFFRADNAGSASGLGLGLYIARMLVEAHGGRIWATSEPGEGSVFTIALPLES